MNYLKEHPISESWFQDRITDATVNYADKFAEYLCEGDKDVTLALTTSQLRKFFGAVKNLQTRFEVNGYNEPEFVLLKPKLAYAVGRTKKSNFKFRTFKIEDFKEVITKAIDIVNNSDDKKAAFKNFIYFFEAVVAYHKVYGRDN